MTLRVLLTILSLGLASLHRPAAAQRPAFADPAAVMEWCDTTVLHPVEGLWIYPEDNVTVAVACHDRTPPNPHTSYDITVVATPDCSLSPGECIGRLVPTVSPTHFRLELFTRRERQSLSSLTGCAAILSDKGTVIQVERPAVKLRFNLFTVLPRFWRLVRASLKNPAGELPEGMVRLYPSCDGNGSMPHIPRYI